MDGGAKLLLAIISLAVITAIYGISRRYIFEIAIITLDFCLFVILGLLSARLFTNARKL